MADASSTIGGAGSATRALLSLVLILGLGGCVLVIGEEDGDRDADWVSASDRQQDRRSSSSRSATIAASADSALREQMLEAFARDELLAGSDLRVSVRGDEVTLYGDLQNLNSFDRAMEIVTGTEGVQQVISRVVVRVR